MDGTIEMAPMKGDGGLAAARGCPCADSARADHGVKCQTPKVTSRRTPNAYRTGDLGPTSAAPIAFAGLGLASDSSTKMTT